MRLIARDTVAVETFALLAISRMSIGMSEAERQLCPMVAQLLFVVYVCLAIRSRLLPRETDQRKTLPGQSQVQVSRTLLH